MCASVGHMRKSDDVTSVRYHRGGITPETHARVTASGRCAYCGVLEVFSGGLEVDHVYPLALGGVSDVSNYAPACVNCNAEKGSQTVDQWYTYRRAQGWATPPRDWMSVVARFGWTDVEDIPSTHDMRSLREWSVD